MLACYSCQMRFKKTKRCECCNFERRIMSLKTRLRHHRSTIESLHAYIKKCEDTIIDKKRLMRSVVAIQYRDNGAFIDAMIKELEERKIP